MSWISLYSLVRIIKSLNYRYLLKRGTTWNDLKWPETTYSEQETTWNDLQWAINDLKRPTTSKTQPTTIWTYQQRAKRDAKPLTTSRFLDYFTVWSNRFSSLTRFPPNIHNHSSTASWRIMVKIERQTFVYYNVNQFDTHKFTFARQKSTLWIKQKKSNFDINKTLRALKMIAWSFLPHHIEKRLNADYILCLSNRIEKFSNLLKIKICF